MTNKLIELFGWYGTVAILGAYAAVSFGVFLSSSPIYQTLNLTGSIGIVLVSINKKAYPPAVLNIIWALVALIALLGLLY